MTMGRPGLGGGPQRLPPRAGTMRRRQRPDRLPRTSGERAGRRRRRPGRQDLAHELGHVRLHQPNPESAVLTCRGVLEVEAESVAYLITAAHGLNAGDYTFPHVTTW